MSDLWRFGLKTDSVENIPIIPVPENMALDEVLSVETKEVKKSLSFQGFTGKNGQTAIIDDNGALVVFVGVKSYNDLYALGDLPNKLPEGHYYLDLPEGVELTTEQATKLTLGWALGAYKFEKFKSNPKGNTRFLEVPEECDLDTVIKQAEATYMVRDLVNRPANDLGPQELEQEVTALAREFNINAKVARGAELLGDADYPMTHAVGRGAMRNENDMERAPRVVDFVWNDDPALPKVTLIGKGLTFDTGGVQVKPGESMAEMKKDMGGAAHAMGIARVVMDSNLPVRLRVIIPIAENSSSANAYRPGDVLESRKNAQGQRTSVEVSHTDAEGRLCLAEALSAAAEENPDLLIDTATLTGAQRVAHGLDVAGYTSTDLEDEFALRRIGIEEQDPVHSLPLHEGYKPSLRSNIADTVSAPRAQGGAITAALFLQQFTGAAKHWIHLDTSAWNPSMRPGRPAGGEAKGMRSLFGLIEKKFG